MRSLRRAATWDGDNATIHAAASSMANGMPSRRRQISATFAILAGKSWKSEDADRARSSNSLTATDVLQLNSAPPSIEIAFSVSLGTVSDGTRMVLSITRANGCREVAIILSCGHAFRSV